MTNAEMAAKYAAEHLEPIQEKCPIVIQHFKRADGHHYWFSHSGKMVITDADMGYNWCNGLDEIEPSKKRMENYNRVNTPSGSRGYLACYANYIEEYGCIELASVHMAGNTGKANESRDWKYSKDTYNWYTDKVRLFMFRGDKHLYDQNGNIWNATSELKYYNKDFEYFCRELGRMKVIKVCEEEFTKFADVKYFHVNSWTESLSSPWSWAHWYKKCTPRPISKTQSSIDKLVNANLAPLKELEKKYPLLYTVKEYRSYYGDTRKDYNFTAKDYIHFEIINDDYCVLRYLRRGYNRWDGSEVSGNFDEPFRIYISATGKTSVTELLDGKYQITSQQLKNLFGYYNKPKFGNLDEIKNWKRLSWIENILTENTDCEITTLLVALLRHPILEITYKAGYKNIFKMLMDNFTVANNLKEIFGVSEKKKGSVTKLLGCNKKTLQWIDENYIGQQMRNYRYLVSTIKTIFGTDDISSWSQESVDLYFKGAKALLNKTGANWDYALQLDCNNRWSWNREEHELTEVERRRYQKVLRTGAKDERTIELLIDTLQSYHSINNDRRPDISDIYDVTTASEMLRYHDGVQEIYNQQEAERRAYWNAQEKQRLEMDKKRFEKLQEDRIKRFEYENEDDDFVIRVPHELTEITNEGISLHHCVAGYVHRHAVGDTNIIFLRHKDMPTLPYYTIEVQNSHVVQIHGSCNKWLGAASDALKAIPFVQKWLKRTGIQCEKNILLCTATGYCSGNSYLDGAQFGL